MEKTVIAKAVASVVAQAATTDAILALASSGKAFNIQLETVTQSMANEVASLGVSASSAFALLVDAYSAALAHLKSQKDTMLKFNSLLFCKIAGATAVEIAPPNAKAKAGAVFKRADALTATEAKKFVAEVRQTVKESEESPEEKAVREKKDAAAKAVANAIKAKLDAEERNKARELAFAFVLSDANHDELAERLLAKGWKMTQVKIPAPKPDAK